MHTTTSDRHVNTHFKQAEDFRVGAMSSNIPAPPAPVLPKPSTPGCYNEVTSTAQLKSKHKSSSYYEPSAEQELVDTRNRLWDLEGWKESPLLTVYQYLPSILQEGPQCGLVALAMASAITQSSVSVQALLNEAQSRGFSYQGEMFSVDDMASLALAVLPEVSVKIIAGLQDNRDAVVHSLAQGAILLVPYPSCAGWKFRNLFCLTVILNFESGMMLTEIMSLAAERVTRLTGLLCVEH
ncbi:hypothetical protein FOCC_FOCC013408 [Frankliniella occidentalis]|nr:hypothetical protein FOCC_FOCC013408 [Frankliniella occidentalis]